MSYEHLDKQLRTFSDKLTEAVRLTPSEVNKVATLIAAEVRFLEPAPRAEVHAAGPVPLSDRLDCSAPGFLDTGLMVTGRGAG